MGAEELSLAEASSLQVATGVNLRSNLAATAALQRLMKRPGGFSDPEGEQDRAVLAAAGVDVANKRTAERIAGVFKRPGIFAELSEDEVGCGLLCLTTFNLIPTHIMYCPVHNRPQPSFLIRHFLYRPFRLQSWQWLESMCTSRPRLPQSQER